MQTASGQTVRPVPGRPRIRPRKGIRPTTIVLGAFFLLLAIGAMVVAFLLLYNPDKSQAPSGTGTVSVTPTSPYASGLKVEKGDAPHKQGDQWVVPLKVTNNVQQPPAPQGTVEPNAPAPAPEPANVKNATIKLFFYNSQDGQRLLVGAAVGNVTDIKYGETKTTEVVATGVSNWSGTDYDAFPDALWTDKDPVKAPGGSTSPDHGEVSLRYTTVH